MNTAIHKQLDVNEIAIDILNSTQEQLWERINNTDFSKLRNRLITDEQYKLSEVEADNTINQYKMFLFISGAYPLERNVPNKAADEAWHLHILNTRKYAKDCQRLFSAFKHHNPYFGGGYVPEEEYKAAENKTATLFKLHFGNVEEYTGKLCHSGLSNCSDDD